MLKPTRNGLAAVIALFLVGCGAKSQQGPDPNAAVEVTAVAVRAQPVDLTVELSGRTSAFLVSDVRPQVGGVVKARLFEEGSFVRAGQPLYQIDPATYQAALSSANADLAEAQANQTAARLKADRYKALVSKGFVSRQANDDAQAAALQAAASVQAARAAVERARIDLGYTRVAAPISGRIGKSSVTAGALVTAGQPAPLAVIQNLDKIYVDVTQSSAELLKLRRDLAAGEIDRPTSAKVNLILEDGSAYPLAGTLAFSDVTVDPGTGSVGLRAVFPNPDGALLPGMYVHARVSKGVAATGILAPQPAVSRNAKGQPTAYVVGPGDKAELRVLTLGQTIGDKWLVTAGLAPGERLITEGLQNIHPGSRVKIAAAAVQP